jgi:hypothetical protein
MDNRDSHLDPGLLEYVTIYSRQPNSNRTNVNDVMQLTSLLQQQFNTTRANQILAQLTRGQTPSRGGGGPGGRTGGGGNNASNYKSILEFYVKSGMTVDEFSQISSLLTTTNGTYIDGLINVNTASVEVLACVPGIGTNNAISMASYRQSSPDKLNSIAWVAEVLDQASAIQAGPFITTECYQFTADIAGVGHNGRGYNRTKYVFDTSEGTPKILYRQDLTRLGWALGNITQLKLQTQLAKETR